MHRYTWVATYADGKQAQRWNEDGTENVPDPNQLRAFHMLPTEKGRNLRPFSLFLKDGQRLIYKKRRHMDASNPGVPAVEDHESVVYIIGWEEDLDYAHFSSYTMLLPDGRIECSSNYNHITLHERNVDEHPLTFYETWSV